MLRRIRNKGLYICYAKLMICKVQDIYNLTNPQRFLQEPRFAYGNSIKYLMLKASVYPQMRRSLEQVLLEDLFEPHLMA